MVFFTRQDESEATGFKLLIRNRKALEMTSMETHRLPFGEIRILREDLAEVIINDGIVMDLAMVEKYHDFLLEHLTAPFSLLVNTVNAYSYDFDAQKKLGTLSEINAMAVVSYRYSTEVTTRHLAAIPREVEWNLQIFDNPDSAYWWLVSQQDELDTSSVKARA